MVQKCGEQDLYNTFLQPYRNNYTLYPVDYNQHQCRGQECLDVDSDNYSLGTPCVIYHRLDKYFATNKSKINVSGNGKCLLENQTQEDNCSFFWSVNCREARTEETHDQNSTGYRSAQLPSTYPPGSAFGSDAENGVLKSWKLLRNEYLDSSESSETNLHEESSGESNIISLQKLQDVPYQLLDQLKDELNNYSEKELPLNEDLRNTFAEIFG
ncbi:unnamed protein product [Rhizophagus irregularis]|nr:unnamed protein product [Rhizophagus irregularis]